MNIIESKEFMLFKNDKGEYHLSHELYNELGHDKAVEQATKEIEKKYNLKFYQNKTINFEQARELGFCEYGIKDFAERLDLNIEKEYTIKELYDKLDVHTFTEYPQECLKLFTNNLFDKFGGIIKLLDENRSQRILNLVINNAGIEDNILHTLAYKSAMRVVNNYEKMYPDDKRVRNAIEAKKKFIDELITSEELSAAESAAKSAAESAAKSAAWSARSAAKSAAESAAKSAAWSAESAAWSAAWSARSAAKSAAKSAAWSAEIEWQIDTLIKLLNGENDE
jgi:hypothetical protein